MVKTHSETNACILQTLLSCIEKITRLDVPPVLRKLDVDALWMQAYKSILEYAAQGLKSLKSSGTIQEDLDDSDYSLIIQRTSNILKRFAQRYGTNDTKDFADYCKNWTENHGPTLWFVLLQLIKNASEIGLGEETMKCLIKSASFFLKVPRL